MSLSDKLKLYVITDRRLRDEIETVKLALEGGARAVQFRVKGVSTREMVKIAKELRKITEEYDALFIVNDRIDVAMAAGADGVHLGKEDMPLYLAKETAPNLILGATVRSSKDAMMAEKDGVDYVGAGSVFPTNTKDNVTVIGTNGLKRIVECVSVPVVAIGGINMNNIGEVMKCGVSGVAVISSIVGAEDVKRSTFELLKRIEEYV